METDSVVQNVTFKDSVVLNSENGARLKTNFNTTGSVSNVTWENIRVENISVYGIDIQQDYLNGGPTGTPSNGVIIDGIYMTNVTGTVLSGADDYYILCGSGSCAGFEFNNVSITGGGNSSCNFQPDGDFTCA
jgi:polygalacturonase